MSSGPHGPIFLSVLFSPLVDLGGHAQHMPPPMGPDFHFDMQNFWNVGHLGGSTAPPYEVHCPPTGNPGSATVSIRTTELNTIKVVSDDFTPQWPGYC